LSRRVKAAVLLLLICCERKTLLNGWLILSDKFKRTGPLLCALEKEMSDFLSSNGTELINYSIMFFSHNETAAEAISPIALDVLYMHRSVLYSATAGITILNISWELLHCTFGAVLCTSDALERDE
jgi:hypothetical protein